MSTDSIEAMADDAFTFIRALGFDKVDIFSFSPGGMVAQALVARHPDLVRKLVLTGTGPASPPSIANGDNDRRVPRRLTGIHWTIYTMRRAT